MAWLRFNGRYYLEDAAEINNRLCSNVAIGVRAAITAHYSAWNDATNPQDERQRAIPGVIFASVQEIINATTQQPQLQSFGALNLLTGTDTHQPAAFWSKQLRTDVCIG